MALAREAGLTEEEFSITSFNHFNDTIPIIINRGPPPPAPGSSRRGRRARDCVSSDPGAATAVQSHRMGRTTWRTSIRSAASQ